jgi:hypothetical protein
LNPAWFRAEHSFGPFRAELSFGALTTPTAERKPERKRLNMKHPSYVGQSDAVMGGARTAVMGGNGGWRGYGYAK